MRIEIPKRLESGQVFLRPLDPGDVESYVQAFKDDADLGRLIGLENDPTPESAADRVASADEVAASGRGLQLAISTGPNAKFAGAVVLHTVSEIHRRCEIGFWVIPSERRTGVGGAAVGRFLDWIFDTLPIDRVEMTTTPDNLATRALAKRLGFTEEGTYRKRNLERGVRVDLMILGLLRDEWPPRKD